MATSTTSSGGFLGFGAYKTVTLTGADAAIKNPTTINSASGQPYQLVGTYPITDASTNKTIETLQGTGKGGIAKAASKFLGTKTSSASSENTLDAYTKNAIQTLFSAEIAVHKSVTTVTASATNFLTGLTKNITDDIKGAKDELNQALQPVSSHTGSVLATMTGILRDPLGSIDTLGKAQSHQADKTNPGFMDRLEATMKKYKIDELKHLPSNIIGGLRSLASTVDALLSLPLSIAADIYNGLMEIVREISELLDAIVSGIMDLIFGPKGLLDSLLPMGDLMDFLEAVGEVADFVGGITGAFSGLSSVTSIVSQVGSFSSLGLGALGNPAALAGSFLPPGASQYISGLRNPDGFVSQLLPPSVKQQLGKISSIPGLGSVGNLGYSIGGTLNSLKGGIAENILNQYSSQIGILGPLLGKPSTKPPYHDQKAAHPPTISGASTNPKIPVNSVHGTPVDVAPQPFILKEVAPKNPFEAATFPSFSTNPNAAPVKFDYNVNKNITSEASYLLKTP